MHRRELFARTIRLVMRALGPHCVAAMNAMVESDFATVESDFAMGSPLADHFEDRACAKASFDWISKVAGMAARELCG